MKRSMMKNRLEEFVAHLGIDRAELAEIVNDPQLTDNGAILEESVVKISQAYPELNLRWLLTGDGKMLRGGVIAKVGRDNSGSVVGTVQGNFNHNADRHKKALRYERHIGQMFDVLVQELNRTHNMNLKRYQDDEKREQMMRDIMNASYVRYERNMERFDKVLEHVQQLAQSAITDAQESRKHMERLLAILEKKL